MGKKKLTDSEVVEIRERYKSGEETLSDISDEYGISTGHTSLIVRGLKRAASPGPVKGKDYSDKTIEERFWEKVDRGDPDECWEWAAATDDKGYGSLWDGERVDKAHRVAYRLLVEEPGDDWVLHHCDNPQCVNPNHLYLGDRADNMRDASKRGRMAILNRAEAVEIRERYAGGGVTQSELADEYGVSGATVRRAVRGDTWDDASGPISPSMEMVGEDHPASKLTAAEVAEIRRRYAGGSVTMSDLADDYEVSFGYIGEITRGEKRTDDPGPIKGEDY